MATNQAMIIVVCLIIQTLSLVLQVEYSLAQGAVIRPTIFSGLPKDSPTDQSQQILKLQTQQQQQQQSQLNYNQQPHQTPQAAIVHNNQDGTQQQQQSPSPPPPTQIINPLKTRFCTGPNGQRLDHALGMQSFAIDNLSLSASSFSSEQVRPHLARLNQDNLGGAWCPRRPISAADFGKEWIQVKLNRSFVVTAIETQGRFALGSGKEFVPSYQVEYSRNNGRTWHIWQDFRGKKLLKANEDVQAAVRNEFSHPIVGANVIRILPYSQHLRTVCMRFELYGCQYDEGAPISYSSHAGVVEPRWGHLIDYTYDGLRDRNDQVSGGLGQLVDGVKGPDNFQHNTGFEWVGWKSKGGDVVIEFTFKTLRNFTGALFYSNNLFSSGVEVFQSVDVHYGIDINLSTEALKDSLNEQRRRTATAPPTTTGEVGASDNSGALSRSARQSVGGATTTTNSEDQQQQHLAHSTVWSSDVLNIEYEPDKKVESSRPVTVFLRQRLANKLRFVLKFASKWILISEVEFLSYPVELMSLASLNEQLTPKLMLDLQQQAKTYDQYVAILREHQLRRIAADEYLNMGAGVGGVGGPGVSTSTSAYGSELASSSSTSETQPAVVGPVDGQQSEQTPPPPSSSASDTNKVMNDEMSGAGSGSSSSQSGQSSGGGQWLPNGQDFTSMIIGNGLPATNPLLNSQPPFISDSPSSSSSIFDKMHNSNSNNIGNAATNDLLAQQQQQQQQSRRTMGLATVISFVFVGIIAFLGTLFAVSSYRLRQAHPKLGSPTVLPRHFIATSVIDNSRKKFITGVFASSNTSAAAGAAEAAVAASASINSSTTAGSGTNTMNNYHQHAHHHAHHAQHHQDHHYHHITGTNGRHLIGGGGQLPDQHYNPLFATSSGRSSEGSLKKSSSGGTGPLTTLKRLAQLTSSASGATSKKQRNQLHQHQHQTIGNSNPLFSSTTGAAAAGHHHQNQLLVSLKDSISSNGKAPNSQTINTQLIVGLNQANPLAHQQIYNSNGNNQIIYNNQQQQQQANYSAATNSMSLASSSTVGNASSGQHNSINCGDYSLATSSAGGDYATPDITPIIQSSSTNLINPASSTSQHFLTNQTNNNNNNKFAPMTTDQFRHSSRFNQTINRLHQQQQQQQQLQQVEHNYEQISTDHQQQQHQQLPVHTSARLTAPSGTMMLHNRTFSNQNQAQANCLFNSMTISNQSRQPLDAASSHYYYADTEAAKSCNLR